jgi:hypothetical protein
MGEAELDGVGGRLIVRSHILIYGNAATAELSDMITAEIMEKWNEPGSVILQGGKSYQLGFEITGTFFPGISPDEIHGNLNPRMNYFRIETYARDNISYVDETGSNTGYFKLENLLNHSTTAAHEYGHSLGLKHPEFLDIRGQGQPGIMYPRGTWVDPPYQYDPAAEPGKPGGTLNPSKRKVLAKDIAALGLEGLRFNHRKAAVVGDFTNLFHNKH